MIVSFYLQALSTSFTTIYSLYNSFVGAPHFAMMTKLLGYQGIAVVIEELLKIIRSLVSTNIICCIKLIGNYLSMKKLDKKCHLQIFVFGLANTSFSNLVSIRFKVWLRLGPTWLKLKISKSHKIKSNKDFSKILSVYKQNRHNYQV